MEYEWFKDVAGFFFFLFFFTNSQVHRSDTQ